ncbi:MAG: hypothetical protein O7G85_13860 [Planctomycetota bacterium]|nr:hypothetical protein [Planctomycetota bacterium]
MVRSLRKPGSSRLMPALALSMLVGVLFGLTSCNTFSTYPPVEITGNMTNPGYEPYPTLMLESIRFAHDHYGSGLKDFAINLPPGVPAEIYDRIIRKLGAGHPQIDPSEKAYHILELRVRGGEAEVDLVYPRPSRIYEMVTIKFRRKLVEGWTVLSSRLWRIKVDIPPPNYVPPKQVELPAAAPEAEPTPATLPVIDEDAASRLDEQEGDR